MFDSICQLVELLAGQPVEGATRTRLKSLAYGLLLDLCEEQLVRDWWGQNAQLQPRPELPGHTTTLRRTVPAARRPVRNAARCAVRAGRPRNRRRTGH
jgi:hypothetical protein